MKIQLFHVSRSYKIAKNNFYAIFDFSYDFPQKGLVSICGKSGSGKSTLLSLLSLMDNPTEGNIYFDGQNPKKWKSKKINRFRNEWIGFIFQHYNLLEEESAIYNIVFPLLVSGIKFKKAKEIAMKNIKDFNLTDTFLNKKVKDLSGGEKQRVAILRSIINNPEVVFADEPTGALDNSNSLITMNILKEISKTKLVIMVSHNKELVESYSDVVLYLKEAKLEEVVVKNQNNISLPVPNQEKRKRRMIGSDWQFDEGSKMFIKKGPKNVISIISLSVGLIASMLIVGFAFGSKDSTTLSSYNQIDYGVLHITHQDKKDVSKGSKISVIRESRPTKKEIEELSKEYSDIKFFPSVAYYFPSDISITCGEENIEKIAYSPLLSFDEEELNTSLLSKGRLPVNNNEVIINKSAYQKLKKSGSEPLELVININQTKEINFATGREDRPIVKEYFIFEEEVKIVGVVDDFSFLTSPKIFYSYRYAISYTESYQLEQLSSYIGEDVTAYDYLFMASDTSEISSYEYLGFYLDYNDLSKVKSICSNRTDNLSISSLGYERTKACLELINACSIGMELFLATAILGTILIIGIVSFSSFSEDKRKIAIMFSLGASSDDIMTIYFSNNLVVALVSLLISFPTSIGLSYLINKLLFSMMGIKNLINIPFKEFLGYRYFFILIIIFALFIITFLSTFIPISFSNKISLKEELREE